MKTIYLSSFCVDFRRYEMLEQLLYDCAEEGPLGVELATSWKYPEFDELLEAQIRRFRDIPVTIHAPFCETCTKKGSAEERFAWVQMEKAFRWYHLFGAGSMVMHTHSRAVREEEIPTLRQRAEEVILETAEQCRREGIRLTVENVGHRAKGNVLYDQQAFIELFDRLPNEVGALIDTGHAMANGWEIPAVIEALGTRIRGYHLHNTDGVHDLHRPMYEPGWTHSPEQMDQLIACIHRISPEADLILEYAPGPHICKALLSGELKRIRGIWDKG